MAFALAVHVFPSEVGIGNFSYLIYANAEMEKVEGAAYNPGRCLRSRERDVCGEDRNVKGDLGGDGGDATGQLSNWTAGERSRGEHRSKNPFLRTMPLRAGVPGTPRLRREAFEMDCGVAYGGGCRERAASQSKAMFEEMDGVPAGERSTKMDARLRGVCGNPRGDGEAGDAAGDASPGVCGVSGAEVDVPALFMARRLSAIALKEGGRIVSVTGTIISHKLRLRHVTKRLVSPQQVQVLVWFL